ncbi:MAG: AmmeMemoRadiSam system protein B [Acidobacteriota bacterium]|jgi:AmmeMemoRadiSam system protein B
MIATVRTAAVAGSWYPGTARAITAEVDRYLEGAGEVSAPGRLIALVSPHAGLRYSGPVAACGYGLLRDRSPLTVVLVGPSHREAFAGVAVHAHGAWETPLGQAPIDESLAEALLEAGSGLFEDAVVHREEHSLEMQMPFLQRLVPELRVVPAMMGTQSRREVDALAVALSRALADREDVVMVASSDLSHFHPADVANREDAVVVEQVSQFDAEALMDRIEGHHNVACGGGPVVAVMKAARALGADRATVLRYADSGDVAEGDKDRVVGYLSAALTAST